MKSSINNKMFLLQCPGCKNRMKYQNRGSIIIKKSKKCVYCGRSFKVRDSIIKKLEK